MPDDVKLTVHTFPMLDTGIGIEAGYESDAAMMEAHRREREALDSEVRAALDEVDAEMTRRFLFGG